MKSFKLESGGSAKEQLVSAGALLLILGIVIYFIWYPLVGSIAGVVGIVCLLAGLFSKN